MSENYPQECKKRLLEELRKLTDTPQYRNSIKLFNKSFPKVNHEISKKIARKIS